MKITIEPSVLRGKAGAPPSKSYAHRLLICSALAKMQNPGTDPKVLGLTDSQDILASKDCIKALVEAKGPDAVYPCRESGSTLRFFVPIAMALNRGGIFTGTKRLIERGISVYEESLDAEFIKTEDSITVKGGLTPGEYTMRGNISSQFISGMLFGLSVLSGDSVLTVTKPIESRAYIDITIDCMRKFGVDVKEREEGVFEILGGQIYRPADSKAEADWSNAAFLYAFNTMGSQLEIEGLNEDSLQGDKICTVHLDSLSRGYGLINLADTPDLAPVLFAVAAAKNGGKFSGITRLRIKESDRAVVMKEELEKFGAECTIYEDDILIVPARDGLKKPDAVLNGHNDHRVVMALSVLCAAAGGTIDGIEAVNKSWPGYFEELKELGLKYE